MDDIFPEKCQDFASVTYIDIGGVEMAGMSRKEAVSATDPDWDRYCLLREDGAETYRCVETAANLSASTEETRLQAYWRHYKTHIEPYTRWTVNRKLFNQTVQYPDPREAAVELVAASHWPS